ncbi:MAG: transglycosylase [Desulfuromonas sp.]|nr:MAG: transglycosylase [Desulfuromonas sp.]
MSRTISWFRVSLFILILLNLNGCLTAPPSVAPPTLTPVAWKDLPGWEEDSLSQAWPAFLQSCRVLKKRVGWQDLCGNAQELAANEVAIRNFFETNFTPCRVTNKDGSDHGLITGYYMPELTGSRTPKEPFLYPLYKVPADLLIVDLTRTYPDLDNFRLRGRVEGRKIIPYYTRKEIDSDHSLLAGNELLWVDDPVDLFFLHIQGSGRIRLDSGETVMVNYADQNGHPFRSIGKLLLERGEMSRDQMSMQNIKRWAQQNPDRVWSLLAENPSYIFFRETPDNGAPPPGALGVRLTSERSIAVDRRSIPLGAPVFLATHRPENLQTPLNRLMLAQDTGGAIRGAVRADFFWGIGKQAGSIAGRMKQQGKMWVLLPKSLAPKMNEKTKSPLN